MKRRENSVLPPLSLFVSVNWHVSTYGMWGGRVKMLPIGILSVLSSHILNQEFYEWHFSIWNMNKNAKTVLLPHPSRGGGGRFKLSVISISVFMSIIL